MDIQLCKRTRAFDLYILNEWIAQCVNFVSIKLYKILKPSVVTSHLNKVRRFTTLQTLSAISQAMRSMSGIILSSLL